MSELINSNKIIEMNTGSILYGTFIEGQSDIDQMGIFIPPLDYYFGLKSIDEIDLSEVCKDVSGKNTSEAKDIKYYSINKFIKLAIENNPNILSQLFVNKENIIWMNEFGKAILDNKHLFPCKGLIQKYIGYAISQSHKMEIKVSNYDNLNLALSWLQEKMYIRGNGINYESSRLLAEFRNEKIPGMKFYDSHCSIGDINISLTDKISKVFNKVSDRLSKVGNREELYTKYGFDTKFGMHSVRLLLEGKTLIKYGYIDFPLKEKDMLLDIRKGKWKKEEVRKFIQDNIKELENYNKSSILPDKPRFTEIENLLISINTKFLFV